LIGNEEGSRVLALGAHFDEMAINHSFLQPKGGKEFTFT